MQELGFYDLKEGMELDFGKLVLTGKEIMEFACRYDPIPFHTDRNIAKQSHFKGLIASGPHLFNAFYLREWIPRFKNSVYAGSGVEKWQMLKPYYENQVVFCKVEVKSLSPKPGKGFGVVKWLFIFENDKKEIYQSLHLTVMHKI